MGLSSSQARLLSITARLTSNEYESQQISNAKMRLSTQTQEASEAYLAALNDTQYAFVSFTSSGESVHSSLTAALLYEYSGTKNQYILTNSAGKVLLSNSDIKNYEDSKNLEDFLSHYGVTRTYKTKTLQESHDKIFGENGLIAFAQYWDYAVENYPYNRAAWVLEKQDAQIYYLDKYNDYKIAINERDNGRDVPSLEIQKKQNRMDEAKEAFSKLVSYTSAKESKIIDIALEQIYSSEPNPEQVIVNDSNYAMPFKVLYEGYNKYRSELSVYNDELNKLGISPNHAYEYNDVDKAQWYTNLWYKINGPSTEKTDLNNYTSFVAKDGIRGHSGGLQEGGAQGQDDNRIPNNDSKILNSSVWISNALSKGLVHIEKAAYSGEEMLLQDEQNPFKFNLHGISWNGQIYSSVAEIVEKDDDKAIAQAEAEYQRKTAEINAKDEKYQRKLSLLDSEHEAIKTEYESVKSAMNKNIDRSFKAFQG